MNANRIVIAAPAFGLLFLASLVSVAAADTTEPATYGAGVTLEKATPIGTLLGEAEEYSGKKVRVDGVVTAVCEKRGCWMQVTDPDSGEGIRIKVDDGVIVFPLSAKGHKASAEGVFEIVQVPDKAAGAGHDCPNKGKEGHDCPNKGKEGHDCPNKGKEGHDCAGHAGSPCAHHAQDKVYLIRGTGAVVY